MMPVAAMKDRLTSASDAAEFLNVWLDDLPLDPDLAAAFQSYYGSYRRSFSARARRHYAEQLTEIEERVRANPGARVLEVGCGMGTESLWLGMQGADMTGVDVRPDRLAVAKARHAVLEDQLARCVNCKFLKTSLLDLPEDEKFDFIWMEQTFHHLEPRAEAVAKIAELLKPGGEVVISEANGWNPFLQAQLFLRRGLPKVVTMTSQDGTSIAYGDERVTTSGALRRTLAQVGISQVSVRHFRAFPNRAVFQPVAGLERALAAARVVPLLTHFNYVGAARP
jgi:2-polyprenyl-3-methyl-5-hydroxy-6-metoxy-1,4-benzoquinol methylase